MRLSHQRGVALVITLIMLSVITVIAVAFLAVSRRERASVSHSLNYVDAEFARNSAEQRAQGEIIANIIARRSTLGPNLTVSQNIDGTGDPYDVNVINGGLLHDPRPPVFVNTNRIAGQISNEFRFYLDLNRNLSFDQTGPQAITNEFGQPLLDDTGMILSNSLAGDPQWLGILADPDRPHSSGNPFIARYAFITLPSGRGLDINYIHNNAKRLTGVLPHGYMRNQGVGGWENNLAAFFTDLNTNVWDDYQYRTNMPSSSVGLAFEDATALLSYRYQADYTSLLPVDQLFPAPPAPFAGADKVFLEDLVDIYADGPLPGLNAPIPSRYPLDDNDDVVLPWPGAESPRHFYRLEDFWNTQRGSGYSNFVDRLRQAGFVNPSTYARNTFYRLAAQLGTESTEEDQARIVPKINLNYDNISAGATNLIPWVPLTMFRTLADRMLGEEFGFGTTNIPIYTNMTSRMTNGQPIYNARVHQILQIAANIVDATRWSYNRARDPNATAEFYPNLPSVFQPLVARQGDDLYIEGYEEVVPSSPRGPGDFRTRLLNNVIKVYELDDPARPQTSGSYGRNVLFYGIPFIVGAREGFPNFNEVALQTIVNVSRKLQAVNPNPGDGNRPTETNQMFIMGISNIFGLEAWNPYPMQNRALQMLTVHQMKWTLTNEVNIRVTNGFVRNNFGGGVTNLYPVGTWGSNEYRLAPLVMDQSLPDSVYYLTPSPHFEPLSLTNRFEKVDAAFTNRWGLVVTNNLLYFMFTDQGEMVDAVSLAGLNSYFNISSELARGGRDDTEAQLWSTVPYRNINRGVKTQLDISSDPGYPFGGWNSYGGLDPSIGRTRTRAVEFFGWFIGLNPDRPADLTGLPPASIGTNHNAPFVPAKRIMQVRSWQVNDPFVHYTLDDLWEPGSVRPPEPAPFNRSFTNENVGGATLGLINNRYRPWGSAPADVPDELDKLPTVKDALVRNPNDWDFPTNKFPSVGWLGRVHRGTPWQTLYLKSGNVSPGLWRAHTGSSYMNYNGHLPTAPTNDWRIVDMVTTAPHPNATRGQLSVNQSGLAAWSAVLSAVPVTALVFTNGAPQLIDKIIEPAWIEPAVGDIVQGINRTRNGQPGNRFQLMGHVLATPELSFASPFLNDPQVGAAEKEMLLTDADYERLPIQILSLLKLGDARFVVYAFGQSLKPAPNSIVRSGNAFGVCTNYQITAETASRSVLRVDFDTDPSLPPGHPDFSKPDPRRPHVVVESYNLIQVD